MSEVVEQLSPVAAAVAEFCRLVLPTQGHYCLWFMGTTQHAWVDSQEALVRAMVRTHASGKPNWYFAPAGFGPGRRRTQENVTGKRCFYFDIDAGAEKLAKHGPDAVYATRDEALAALVAFSKKVQLPPSLIVFSGTGLHVYYALDTDLTQDDWRPIAARMGKLAKLHGLKVDASCTTDSARVLRPVGALHGNGQRVTVLKNTGKVWGADELRMKLASLLGADEGEGATLAAPKRVRMEVNAGLAIFESAPVSAEKVAASCEAFAEIVRVKGDVAEPPWRGGLGILKHCVNGEALAHDLSRGHPDYDPDKTDAKFAAYKAGPTTCEYFGQFTTACDTCEHKGKIKSPISLGRLNADDIKALPEAQRPEVPAFVAELNKAAAIVLMGGEVRILLENQPHAGPAGLIYRADWVKPSAFHQLFADRTVVVNGRTVQASQAWMRHAQRRQYTGAVFAPGETVPAEVLNLYEGFAVQPTAGDVGPWLRLLDLLVPIEAERRFLLLWLAWKVQNPGGVPGTIPILTGAKGTGKNSLFEPIVRMFGSHGAIFDDPELVVGRFTGHLMTLCFVVLDEAMFAGDPRQNDRIKARVTATSMQYEFKGFTPVAGVNRCAFALITNHAHVWHATLDERRAFVITVGEALRGAHEFWASYYAWLENGGASALLHYLLALELRDFNPRHAPNTATLAQQVQLTALRTPAAAWWHSVLSEGVISGRDDGGHGFNVPLNPAEPTTIEKSLLRNSFASSGGGRVVDWATAARQLRTWVPAGGVRNVRVRDPNATGGRGLRTVLAPLTVLRAAFTTATGIHFVADADQID